MSYGNVIIEICWQICKEPLLVIYIYIPYGHAYYNINIIKV